MSLSSIPPRPSVRAIAFLSVSLAAATGGTASAATLFESYLERGYSEVAVYARTKAFNTPASIHFARKAAYAANGQVVVPDSPADTGRPLYDLVELYDARTKLMEAMAAGIADANARVAAVAQVNYDCWLAQLSAGSGDPDSSSCRLLFYTALDMLTAQDVEDFITVAGPANAETGLGDHAAGGNDRSDRLPPPAMLDPSQGAPISALSIASGEYETAVWIYPAPVATPPSAMPGGGLSDGGSENTAESGTPGDADEATGGLGSAVSGTSNSLGGAVSGAGGALGDTVGGVAGAAGGTISGAGNAIGGPVGGIADAAGDTVSGLGGAVGNTIGGVSDGAGRAVSGLGGALGGALGADRAN